MADKKISDFATLTDLQSNDLLLVSSLNETYNTKVETLMDSIKADGVVLFDQAQSLTNAQKATARGNIGAVEIDIEGTALVIGGGTDFYDQWAWSSVAGGNAHLTRLQYGVIDAAGTDGHIIIQIQDHNTNNKRRSFAVMRGVTPMQSKVTGEASDYYPIPVPAGATKVTATLSDANQYCAVYVMRPVGDGQYDAVTPASWQQGVNTVTFTAGEGLVVFFNCKYDSAGSQVYPSGSDPEMTLIFE